MSTTEQDIDGDCGDDVKRKIGKDIRKWILKGILFGYYHILSFVHFVRVLRIDDIRL